MEMELEALVVCYCCRCRGCWGWGVGGEGKRMGGKSYLYNSRWFMRRRDGDRDRRACEYRIPRLSLYFILRHQSRHLPTARIPPSTPHPIILTLTRFFPQPIQRIILFHRQRLLHFLFEFCRLLSIVPAVLGTMWNLYSMIWLPGSTGPNLDEGIHGGGWGRRSPPERVDFFVATLWVRSTLLLIITERLKNIYFTSLF